MRIRQLVPFLRGLADPEGKGVPPEMELQRVEDNLAGWERMAILAREVNQSVFEQNCRLYFWDDNG